MGGSLEVLGTPGAEVSRARAQTVTKILDNGPDAEKKVLVVIGDGFTSATMADYHQYVQDNVLDGVFAQDAYFRANHSAFNVYTGCWGRCWLEGSSNTESTIKSILDQFVPKRDLEIRVLNVLTGQTGGCGGGGKLAVTTGANWTVLAHEMGHMVSGLYDEYVASDYANTSYPGGSLNTKNCSTVLSRTDVVWSDFLFPNIAPPTVWDASTMDPDETVGEFEGCKTYGRDIYRPVNNCRMRGNSNEFCPVCRDNLKQTLAGFPDTAADYSFYANYPGAACKATGTASVSYNTAANVSNPAAASATVLCPTRRVQDSGSFTNHLLGQAFVVDQHPTENVCCQLFARTPAGNVSTGATVCSEGSSGSMQSLQLDFPKVRMDYTFAHFALTCTLPASSSGKASSVLTYRIGQQLY